MTHIYESRRATHGKVIHIGKEDVDLDNLRHLGTGGLNNGLKVLAALGRLFANGSLNEGHIGSERDLTRAVDGQWGLNGLRLCMQMSEE